MKHFNFLPTLAGLSFCLLTFVSNAAVAQDAGATDSPAAAGSELFEQPPRPAAAALEQQPLQLADAAIDAAIAAVERLPQAASIEKQRT